MSWSISLRAAFLGAQAAGEVAEMIHRERQIGSLGLANRLAVVVDRLTGATASSFCSIRLRDLVGARRGGRRGVAPKASLARCAASSASSMSSAVERAIVQTTDPSIGDMFSILWPFAGGTQLTADEIVVVLPDRDLLLDLGKRFLDHYSFSSCIAADRGSCVC